MQYEPVLDVMTHFDPVTVNAADIINLK
jgi:hypothetical protein